MKRIVCILLIVIIGFHLSASPQASALSCAPPGPVQEEMDRSSVVFKGKAVEIKSKGLTVFQVEEAWKGIESARIEIYDNDGWDPYVKNADYLVFGGMRDGKLKTHLCGRTGIWDKDREDAMKEANLKSVVFAKDAPSEAKEPSEPFEPPSWTFILSVIAVFRSLLLFL